MCIITVSIDRRIMKLMPNERGAWQVRFVARVEFFSGTRLSGSPKQPDSSVQWTVLGSAQTQIEPTASDAVLISLQYSVNWRSINLVSWAVGYCSPACIWEGILEQNYFLIS